MLTQRQLWVLVVLGGIVWLGSLALQGASVDLGWLKSVSGVVTVLSVALSIFDSWIWRLQLLHPWFVPQPNVCGTWKTELDSTWTDLETNQTLPTIEAYVVIRQRFSCVTARLMTKESESVSMSASLNKNTDGLWSFASVYRNTPRATLLDRSVQHLGAFNLDVRGEPPYKLDGQYWTNRNTRGEMRLLARNRHLFADFQSAAAARYEVLAPN